MGGFCRVYLPVFQCVFMAFVCFYRPLEIVFVYGLAAHFTAYGFQGFACSRLPGLRTRVDREHLGVSRSFVHITSHAGTCADSCVAIPL